MGGVDGCQWEWSPPDLCILEILKYALEILIIFQDSPHENVENPPLYEIEFNL